MKKKNLIDHITATYRALRLVLVAIGFALPLVLAIGYSIKTGVWDLQNSLSAYYHAPLNLSAPSKGDGAMRDWFVGALFATGVLLLAYKGFTPLENYALNLAGVLAALVALFPMEWPTKEHPGKFSIHGVFAVSFFISIAYVCIFQASATLTLIQEETRQKHYNWVYKILGLAMVAFPSTAFILIPKDGPQTFFIEAAGVYVFAIYWLVKSIEIRETQADMAAAKGKLVAPQPEKLSDAFRQMPITSVDNQP